MARKFLFIDFASMLGLHKFGSAFHYHEFANAEDKIVLNVVKNVSKEGMHQYIESQLDRLPPMDPAKLLWSAELISHSKDEHHVIIWQFHSITDGAASMRLLAQLTAELEAARVGAALPERATPTLQVGLGALVHSLPSWGRIALWKRAIPRAIYGLLELRHMKSALRTPIEKPVPAAERSTHYLHASLSPAEVTKLRNTCREQGVTVSAATIAAVALAIKEMGLPDSGVYRLHTPINIRERLNPPVKNEQFMCGIVATDVDVPLSADLEFWALAKHIHSTFLTPAAVEREVAEGALFLEGISSLIQNLGFVIAPKMLRTPDERGVMSVSCFGAYGGDDFPLKNGQFSIQDLEITAPTGPTGSFPMCMSFTYQGTFYLSLTYVAPLLSKQSAEKALQTITKLMRV